MSHRVRLEDHRERRQHRPDNLREEGLEAVNLVVGRVDSLDPESTEVVEAAPGVVMRQVPAVFEGQKPQQPCRTPLS